jgi:hypothetical protein
MSVVTPLAGELFTLRIEKSLVANPALTWFNTYEFEFNPVGSMQPTEELMAVCERLLDFEKQIHHQGVSFVQYTVSTWNEEVVSYDPASFVTVPLPSNTVGMRDYGFSDALPLNIALYVRRQVPSGRQGKLFYRGVLAENDVAAQAGVLRLTNPDAMGVLVDNAISGAQVDGLFYPAGEGANLVMVGKTTGGMTHQRYIQNLVPAGVTIVSRDHRWYNVKATPPSN